MSRSDISIEPFRGDYENLEQMAFSSWRDEYGLASFPNLYQPEYLKFLFEPIKDKRHLITAYRGNEIVAFFASLPRRYHFQGKIYRGVLSCLLVTRKEFLRQGLALAIIDQALKLNRSFNYDFALLYLETGHRSTRMIEKLKQAGQPVEWVKRMSVLGRVLDLKKVSESESLKRWERAMIRIVRADQPPPAVASELVRGYQPKDLEQCLALLNQYQERVTLARVWEREELSGELAYPEISQTLVYEKNGKIAGLINWTYHLHLGRTKERWAWLNHISYPGLSASERLALIQAFLAYIKTAGCIGAIEWTKKYYPMTPIYRAHFFPYFRAVNLISWNFNPGLVIKNIPDVYEVQI